MASCFNFQKRSTVFLTLYALVILTCLSSCTVKNPELKEISSIEFLDQRDTVVFLSIDAVIYNHQRINAQVSKIQGDLFLENTLIARVDNNQKIEIKARDTSTVKILVSASLPLLSTVFPSVMASDSVDFTLNGDFFVDIGVSDIRISRKISKRIDIQDEIKKQISTNIQNAFVLKRVMPKIVKIDSTVLQLDLEFINPLGIEFILKSAILDFSLKSQNNAFGRWEMPQPVRLAPGDTRSILGEITVDNGEVFRQSVQSIFGTIVLQATGNATVQLDAYEFIVPVAQTLELKKAMGF